jgi:hypothetical protein
MTPTSQVSPEERLERKRRAARLRQQRCRIRKREEAMMAKEKEEVEKEQTQSTPFVEEVITPAKENKHPNHYLHEPPTILRKKIPYSFQWNPYWGENAYHHQEAPSFRSPRQPPYDYLGHCGPIYQPSPNTIYENESPRHQYHSYSYEQRCPSFDQNPPYTRDEYTIHKTQTPIRESRPPPLPMLPPARLSHHYHHDRSDYEERRASPESHISGRPSFEKKEEAAIDAILSLKHSVPKQPRLKQRSAKCHPPEVAFRPYQRPTPPRLYEAASSRDHQRSMKPGFYLTMRFK